jgi:hypothetical protein
MHGTTIKKLLCCVVSCRWIYKCNVFSPFVFISQSEVKYNTITPVVKKSYGLYFESKFEGPSFSCLLFMLLSVWCGHGWMERNVLCDLLHALFAGHWKTVSLTSSIAWLMLRNTYKRNALSNTQFCHKLCGRWHRTESWDIRVAVPWGWRG